MPTLKTSARPVTDLHYEDLGHGQPFGESGRPPGGYDYATFASDLNDLLTHLDLHDVVLVGFSMGGGEVARYVGHYGTARVAATMLLGAVTPFLLKTDDHPEGLPGATFDRMLAEVRRDRIAFLDGFFRDFYNLDEVAAHPDLVAFSKWIAWQASPLAMQHCVVAFGTTDFRRDLDRFDVPTLIAHGDADRIVPIEISGRRAHERIRGSRFEVLRGCPHGFAATHPERLDALMLDFLRTVRAKPAAA